MKLSKVAAILLLFAGTLWSQQPATTTQGTAEEALQAWRKSRAAVLMDDFGELSRYQAANAALGKPKPGEARVVFFGDSITDFWSLQKFFPGTEYINRGISGQTTSQMLLRFRQDVVEIGAKIVVILA